MSASASTRAALTVDEEGDGLAGVGVGGGSADHRAEDDGLRRDPCGPPVEELEHDAPDVGLPGHGEESAGGVPVARRALPCGSRGARRPAALLSG